MANTLNPTPRQSPSGRFRDDVLVFSVDPSVGDVPLLTSAGWVGTPIAGIGAYDFVLRSRADLLAVPSIGAGPLYSLPNGSYALKAGFSLNAGESLQVPNGGNVLFDGMGLGQSLSAAPGAGPLLNVLSGGSLQSRNLHLENTSVGGIALQAAGNLDLVGASLEAQAATGAGLVVTGGDVSDRGSRILADANAIRQTGGTLRLVQTVAQGGGACFSMQGGTAMAATAVGATFISAGSANAAVAHTAAAGELELDACLGLCDTDAANVVTIAGALSCLIRGGRLQSSAGTPGNGVQVAGDITGGLEVNGTRFLALAVAVARSAGTQNRVALIGLDGGADVVLGVDWAAASIPTNGLIELGCQFNVAAPFANHTAADARVNRKACTGAGALLAETAIV